MRRRLGLTVVLIFACSSPQTPAGHEGGPCYGNGTCDDTLACRSKLCVNLGPGGSATAGQGGGAGTSGSGDGRGSQAATCVESSYPLGCIGDGRDPVLTTDGSKPAKSCGVDNYAYFKLDLRIGTVDTPRSDIAHCTLEIAGDGQSWRQTYDLPSGTAGGSPYGCSPGQTPQNLGTLSYSCCHPPDILAPADSIGFWLSAYGSDGSVVATDHVFQSCTRPDSGLETRIILSATSLY